MNFYFIFISFQSGVSIINKANRQYNCKFCSEEFKWQYELLKHCVFRHFLDDIKKDLPDEFPAKCPKCEFTGRNRSTLVLHYGVTHRVIQKLIEDAQSNPESVANKLRAPPRGATAAATSASASQQSQVERPFSCPLCSLKVSRRQQMDHLCTHFSERLSQRLPAAGPFACPDCRFVGTDRRRLVRHYGGHHGHAHALLVEHLRDAGKDVTAADVVKQERVLSGGETTRIPPPPEFAFECQLCDSLPVYKNKSELCKHLSESHFMERIMSELPPLPVLVSGDGGDSLPGAADGAEGLKAFKCNRPGCNYSSTTRNSLLTHVAVFHRVALKLYLDVVGQSELPNDVDNLEGNLREIKTNDDHNQFPKIDKGKYVLHPRNPNITHDFSDPILVHTNTAEAMIRRGMRYIFGGPNPSISKIVEINYIENKALEDKFMAKKEEFQAQNKDTSELLLFHGTSYASTHSICESNFKLDMLGRSYYGRGIYFSR